MKEIIELLKKYTDGKHNIKKVEISVLQLNRIIKALEQEPNLDEIRAEIERVAEEECKFNPFDQTWACGLKYALEIIDKYKAKSEDKE